MIQAKDFYCQFTSFSNPNLAKKLCGVTSLAMVLSAENKLNGFTDINGKLDNFLSHIVGYHKNNVVSVKRKYELSSGTIYITSSFNREDAQEGDLIENDLEFFPVFSTVNGYDHRSSELILSKFGLEGGYKIEYDLNNLWTDLRIGKHRYFMASIKSGYTSGGTHVVVVHKVYEKPDKQRYLEVVDPAKNTFDSAVITYKFSEFESVYNNFGSFIK